MRRSGRDGPTAMSAEADEMSFLRYRTGERIKVGDFVRELVDGHERNGIVDRVYDPDSIAAEVFGLLRGFCSVTWSDRKFPTLMTPDDIRQENGLLFVHWVSMEHPTFLATHGRASGHCPCGRNKGRPAAVRIPGLS